MVFRTRWMVSSLVATWALMSCATTPPPVDRTVTPPAAPARAFEPPPVQRSTLSNGLQVMLMENHELPIAGFSLTLRGGSALDPVGKEGLANLTAAMLARGTEKLDALALDDAFTYLGTDIGSGADVDSSMVTMITLTKHLDKSLELMSGMAMSPRFAEEELVREREEMVTAILQSRDRAEVLANNAFYTLLFGNNYRGRPTYGTEAGVANLTREDCLKFYQTWYHPNNAILIVTGDLTMEQLVPSLEKTFGAWQKGVLPEAQITIPEPPRETVVYLMDRPGAAQSQLRVGTVGIARNSPEYIPAVLWNMMLGGTFASRMNLNLREDKGYTYGANSGFDASRLPGAWVASTGVKSDTTAASVVELVKEVREIGTTRPPTDAEIDEIQDFVIKRFPSGFEGTSDMLGRLQILAVNDLPEDYFTTYVRQVQAVSREQVRAQSARINPDALLIVVVGDKAVVEQPLKDAGFKVMAIDRDGKVIP